MYRVAEDEMCNDRGNDYDNYLRTLLRTFRELVALKQKL